MLRQSLLLWLILFYLLQLQVCFFPSLPSRELPSLLVRLSFNLPSSYFLRSSVTNSITRLFSQKFSKVFSNLSGSVLMRILPALRCLITYSLSSLMLSSQMRPSLAKQVMSPARQFSPLRMAIWSCRVSTCSEMNSVILIVSFLSQTSSYRYLETVQVKSFSSQTSKRLSNSLTISSLSSWSWLWMLSLKPDRQSKMRSLLRLNSSNTTMCWQHFWRVSASASCKLTQVGLLFSRKCCSVCSTMQLGQSGMRHSGSQQKLVRIQLGWQAQKIFLASAAWFTRDIRWITQSITDHYNRSAC